MKVQFHDPEEFLAEVRRDAERVDRKIVRVTIRRRYRPPFVTMSVIATAVVSPTVITLDHRVGETFSGDGHDSDLVTKATATIDKVTRVLNEIGLEVRPGVFEPNSGE
ncbi:MAG: hypothetical protein K8U57_04120 [Planctomycetes bacterium]|nr:hypothetical protein [Planctomycetota bacterium]